MYGQEKIMHFRRTETGKSDQVDFTKIENGQCLLDFSNGPNSVIITNIKVQEIKAGDACSDDDKRVYHDFDKVSPVAMSEVRTTKSVTVCSFCGKSFGHRGDYNKHVRRHTGERPYACTKCPRNFSLSSNLKRHEKLHSGDMPFECTTCGKRFSRKDKLTAHQKRNKCDSSEHNR